MAETINFASESADLSVSTVAPFSSLALFLQPSELRAVLDALKCSYQRISSFEYLRTFVRPP